MAPALRAARGRESDREAKLASGDLETTIDFPQMSDSEDDDALAIGFMFDREASKTLRTFTLTSFDDARVELAVPCWCQTDDEPGADE